MSQALQSMVMEFRLKLNPSSSEHALSTSWEALHRWQSDTSSPCSLPGQHSFPRTIKLWKSPHNNTACTATYKYTSTQTMAKWVTINNSKNRGDPVSPILLPKAQNVCSVFWYFFFKLHFWFASDISYLDPLLSISNFICDLTRTCQSIQDWQAFKALGF